MSGADVLDLADERQVVAVHVDARVAALGVAPETPVLVERELPDRPVVLIVLVLEGITATEGLAVLDRHVLSADTLFEDGGLTAPVSHHSVSNITVIHMCFLLFAIVRVDYVALVRCFDLAQLVISHRLKSAEGELNHCQGTLGTPGRAQQDCMRAIIALKLI